MGIQAGLLMPTGKDLKATTGPGMGAAYGLHGIWELNEFDDLCLRLDLLKFRPGQQDATTPMIQRIETQVQTVSLGTEFLYHLEDPHQFDERAGRWAVGAGLYVMRWSVESTNQVTIPGAGTARASGTSQWTRLGVGLVGTCRVTRHLEAEARWLYSHYGYENLPVTLGTLGLVWRF
jgi:hypothetical protein